MGVRARLLSAAALILVAAAASSQETITYSYDAKGRLTKVDRDGGINDGVDASYLYDKADNRTQVIVTGAGVAGPGFSAGDASGTEGGTVTFMVTRNGDTSAAQSVSYASASHVATSGSDFTAVSGTLNFAIGETSKPVVVTTLQDTLYEGTETFHLNLSNPTNGATINDPQGVGTILDDDQQVSFAINDPSVTEGGTLQFTVTKSGSNPNSFTVDYATANGTTTSSDYTATSGTLTFTSAQTTHTISVATIDDTLIEASETVLVNLSNPSPGSAITDPQGVGTILDNDAPPPPSLAINDAGTLEGMAMTFTVTRSGSTSGTVTVDYATATGTAGPGDFTAVSGTLTFISGQPSKTITVQTSQDIFVEDTEIFYVNLSNASGGATISDAQGIGTITDDDEEGGFCPNCSAPQSTPPEISTSTPEAPTTSEPESDDDGGI